jgi:prepilin-type N-terminal cleavage/methylation domain-containing protein
MRQRGFSLVEMLVVMAIMGVLLVIVTLNWNQMQTKSAIESEIKTIHADLMELRQQALYSKRARSVVISGQSYQSYSSAVVTSTALVTKQLRYPVLWNSGGVLTFDRQGLASTGGTDRTLCVSPTNNLTVINKTAVDSLVISDARINLGQRTGACDSDHIDQK